MRFTSLCATVLLSLLLTLPGRADSIIAVPLVTNDIVYDPGTQLIYASVPSSVGSTGNSIATIDPNTGAILSTVFVGSEPNHLARASDGQSIYVGLDGASAIRRFWIGTQTAGEQFPVRVSGGTSAPARCLAAVPGAPDSVVAAAGSNGGPVVIFDRGVARPATTQYQQESYSLLAFSASPDRLYALGYASSLTRLQLAVAGVVSETFLPGTINGYFESELVFRDGRIYANGGEVFDPEANLPLGAFDVTSASSVEVDTAGGRAFFASGGFNSWTISAFDIHTFTPIDSIPLPKDVDSPPSRLMRWGVDGLAFRTASHVYLVRTSLVTPARTADLRLSLSPSAQSVPAATQLTYTLTVTNAGNADASGVVLTNTFDGSVAYISGDASQGALVQNDSLAVASLGTIPAGGSATVHLTVKPSLAGTIIDQAVVTSEEEETAPLNTAAQVSTAVTAPTIPDLTGAWVKASVVCGGNLSPTPCDVEGIFKLENVGLSTAGPSVVQFFLSLDPASVDNATKIGTVHARKLGGRKAETFRLKLPHTSVDGGVFGRSIYLVAVVNADNSGTEATKSNNVIAAGPF